MNAASKPTLAVLLLTRASARAARWAASAGLSAGVIAIAIAVGAEAAEVPVWKSQHKTGPTAARTGIEDCTVTAPAGVYEMVHLEFDAPVKWTYLGSCRDGKIRMDNLIGLREPGGWLTIQGNRLTGTFVRSINRQFFAFSVDATLDGDVISGTVSCRKSLGTATPQSGDAPPSGDAPQTGKVTGVRRSEAELAKINPLSKEASWPNYGGPAGFGRAAKPAGAALVDGIGEAKVIWRSEEQIGQMLAPLTRFMYKWGDASTIRTSAGSSSPILEDGRIFVHLRYPRGDDYYLDDGRHGPHNMVEEARKAGYAELPDFAKEKILQSADEVMVAMDARTGKTLWKAVIASRAENNQNHKDRGFDRTPAAGEGKVVGIGRHGTLFCFDAASGKPLWEAPAGVSHGTKLVIAEGIVVAPKDGCWAGFDLNTGKLVWKHPEPIVSYCLSVWPNGGRQYLVGYAGGKADKGGVLRGGNLVCIDTKTGTNLWSMPFEATAHHGGVAIQGDILLGFRSGGEGGKAVGVAYRLSAKSAEKFWEVPDLDGFGYYPPMPVAGKYVFLANSNDSGKHTHVVVDLMTGKQTSTVTGIAPGNGGYVLSMEDLVLVRPDGTHGRNVFGSYKVDAAGQAKALDSTGWAPPFYNSTSYHMPVMYPVAEGRIFLRLGDGIYCYDLRKSSGRLEVEQAIHAAGADADAVVSRLLTLATETDVQVREFAGRELAARVAAGQANSRQAEVLPVLVRLMAETEPELRRQLAPALAALGEAAVPILVESSRHPRDLVRIAVVEALGQMGGVDDPRIDKVLLAALEDGDPAVVEATLTSLGKRPTKLDLYQPVLVKLIDASPPPVDRQAMMALLRILPNNVPPQPRPKKLESLLVELLSGSKDVALAYRAVDAIRALGDDDALRIFIGVLEADNPGRGARVAVGLAAMGARAKPALPALERAMVKWKGTRSFMRSAEPAFKTIQEAE
jgi:outer membrane protein assembly factor BamB